MKYCLLLLAAICLFFPGQAQRFSYRRDYEPMLRRSKDPADAVCYTRLLPRFLKGDSTLSISEMLYLMIGYTGRTPFTPYDDLVTEKRIYEYNNKAQYQTAIHLCDSFLKRRPLNQQAIIEKAYAFHKLNRQDSATWYKAQFGRLMAAMDWSADGRTPDHAMFAIGPRDGQNFIDKYYHADLGRSGSAEDSDGNFCDMLEMKFKKGGKAQSVTLYFAIQHAVNTTAAPRRPQQPSMSKQR
ncbi:DUF4919 domain-containing protein [Taibaiella koreensis]|uniref:DUF4919 domain-containing protein n=1 Tax=Taibaiella koreensis TaxID=1268548 RepID=UPI000E59CBA5|nr:DUF4919 domain-containing protein [Taibaiella koreensis]